MCFFPAGRKLKTLLRDGIIGLVYNLHADFACSTP